MKHWCASSDSRRKNLKPKPEISKHSARVSHKSDLYILLMDLLIETVPCRTSSIKGLIREPLYRQDMLQEPHQDSCELPFVPCSAWEQSCFLPGNAVLCELLDVGTALVLEAPLLVLIRQGSKPVIDAAAMLQLCQHGQSWANPNPCHAEVPSVEEVKSPHCFQLTWNMRQDPEGCRFLKCALHELCLQPRRSPCCNLFEWSMWLSCLTLVTNSTTSLLNLVLLAVVEASAEASRLVKELPISCDVKHHHPPLHSLSICEPCCAHRLCLCSTKRQQRPENVVIRASVVWLPQPCKQVPGGVAVTYVIALLLHIVFFDTSTSFISLRRLQTTAQQSSKTYYHVGSMFSATTFIAMQHNRSRVLQLQHTFFSQLEDLVRGAAFFEVAPKLGQNGLLPSLVWLRQATKYMPAVVGGQEICPAGHRQNWNAERRIICFEIWPLNWQCQTELFYHDALATSFWICVRTLGQFGQPTRSSHSGRTKIRHYVAGSVDGRSTRGLGDQEKQYRNRSVYNIQGWGS